jgi:hypothetical protein
LKLYGVTDRKRPVTGASGSDGLPESGLSVLPGSLLQPLGFIFWYPNENCISHDDQKSRHNV